MRCVAVQTVRHLYELSSEEEALALLADTATYVRSTDMPSYPRRYIYPPANLTFSIICSDN